MVVFRVILLLIIVISSAIFTYILFAGIFKWLRKRKLTQSGIDHENLFTWFMRNGISIFKKPAKFLISRSYKINNFYTNVVLLLNEKGIKSNKVACISTSIGFVLFISAVVSLLFSSLIAGIAIILLAIICSITAVNSAMDKRREQLRHSIPETLRSMSTCFGAGYTVSQTFDQVSSESKGSINKLFAKATHIMQVGGSINESLDVLKKESEAPELAFVAVALNVQHDTGGSMKPVIEAAKEMVESKLNLLRLLKVQTSQAKLSAKIVTILPFALIAIFSLISPNFLQPFFSSFLGVCVFIVACIMQAAGIVLVKKMLKVEI